jgi:hypothetical protein
MRKTGFLALASVTALVAVGAMVATQKRAPESALEESALFPGLAERVNDVGRIAVKSKDLETRVRKDGEGWVIENRDGFPARFDKVKATVVALADLEVLARKTSNKELYPRLGVEGIEAEPATSVLVSLADGQDQALAALLVGKPQSGGSSGTYVRRPDEAQSWLVGGELGISADPVEWMERDLLDIGADRIREITIEKSGEQPVRVFKKARKDEDYVLADLPKGSKLKSQLSLNGLAGVFEQLRLDDVKKRAGFELPKGHTVTTVRGFDGLVAVVESAVIDDKTHAVFEFSYDAAGVIAAEEAPDPKDGEKPAEASGTEPKKDATATPSVADEVAALNTKMAAWVYLLPSHKATLLAKGLAELTDTEEQASSAPPKPQ